MSRGTRTRDPKSVRTTTTSVPAAAAAASASSAVSRRAPDKFEAPHRSMKSGGPLLELGLR